MSKEFRITKNNDDGTAEITHLSINDEKWVKQKDYRNQVIDECIKLVNRFAIPNVKLIIPELEKLKV